MAYYKSTLSFSTYLLLLIGLLLISVQSVSAQCIVGKINAKGKVILREVSFNKNGKCGKRAVPTLTGEKGDSGAQGEPGTAGLQGDQGTQGTTGLQGEQGTQGATGASGMTRQLQL